MDCIDIGICEENEESQSQSLLINDNSGSCRSEDSASACAGASLIKRTSEEDGIVRRRSHHSTSNVEMDYRRLQNIYRDGLHRFKMALACFGLYDSCAASLIASWMLFSFFTVIVPTVLVLCVTYSSSDTEQIQLNAVVQISESSLAAISFLFLSHNLKQHGLQKLLFLDKIERQSEKVQIIFKRELTVAVSLVVRILLPCFIAEIICQIWWFTQVSVKLLFIEDTIFIRIILCGTVLLSWLYRMSLFLIICVLFRLMCSLMLSRFEDYSKLFKGVSDVSIILKEHMNIRQQLFTISHRFRIFILSSLVAITVSQFVSLFIATASSISISLPKAGNLVVCAAVQVTGFVLCLHGAARITHRAQRIVSMASQWHALVTCQSYTSDSDTENMTESLALAVDDMSLSPSEYASDLESVGNICNIIPSKDEFPSYEERQAFVLYLQHSNAGISLYGFVLDRGFIYTIFGLQLSVILFILSLTIGVK
ncbi:uncharacterized protein LOC131070454 [Cryptomeria japonica]|uniref:uncharacterized protein LOC131070454 n=1 Tax=Cryptomeria japonica TaxID=3369 RepID=UPI0025AC8F49|nr:uncharacterized protein LOC131070454 [Cryptomeria japonica]